MKIKHVEDCAIVKLPDGRVGWKGKNTLSTHYNRIIFADQTGVELQPNDEVEVVMHPANLASEYVKSLPIQQEGCQHHQFKITIMEEQYEDYFMTRKPDGTLEITDTNDDAEPCSTEEIAVSCELCPWVGDYSSLESAPLWVQQAYHTIYHQ